MNLPFSIQKFFLLLLIVVSTLFAEPQIIISSISSERVKAKLSELEYLKQKNYDENTKTRLNALWEKATKLAKLNDMCAEISLNEELNTDCHHFYQIELPEFENEYLSVTGEIRLNGLQLSKNMNELRKTLIACYDALPLNSVEIQDLFAIEGDFIPQPLQKGTLVEYKVSLIKNSGTQEVLEKNLNLWYQHCGEYIFSQTDQNTLAPLFLEKINESSNQSLQLVPPDRYNDRDILKIKANRRVSLTYLLNGKTLFTHTFNEGDIVALLDLNPSVNQLNYERDDMLKIGKCKYSNVCYSTYESWEGNIKLSSEEERNGLQGHVKWNGGQNNFHNTETTNRENGFKFQAKIALLAGIPNKISGKFLEDHSNVSWEKYSKDSITITTFTLTAAAKYYGEIFNASFGGGFALQTWQTTEREEDYYYSSESNEPEFFKYVPSPIFFADFGHQGEILELGARYTFLLSTDYTTQYLGGYARLIDFIEFELGWFYTVQYTNGLYFGFGFSFPPRN